MTRSKPTRLRASLLLTVALGAGSVWTTDDSGLLRLDARTGARQAFRKLPFLTGYVNTALAVGSGSVWETSKTAASRKPTSCGSGSCSSVWSASGRR